MIHGDLKGVRHQQLEAYFLPSLFIKLNVLVDDSGHARLADFGLLTILSDPANGLTSSSLTQGGTARWMGPELFTPQRFGLENSRPTRASDCYALGMVIYETISGHFPFHKDANLTFYAKVLEGERPSRETCFTDTIWRILEACWKPQPGDRPSIEDVLRRLEMEPPSARSDVEMEEDGDDSDSSDDISCEVSRFIPSAESHGSCSYLNRGSTCESSALTRLRGNPRVP